MYYIYIVFHQLNWWYLPRRMFSLTVITLTVGVFFVNTKIKSSSIWLFLTENLAVILTLAFCIQTKTSFLEYLKASHFSIWRFLRESLGVRLKSTSWRRAIKVLLRSAQSFSGPHYQELCFIIFRVGTLGKLSMLYRICIYVKPTFSRPFTFFVREVGLQEAAALKQLTYVPIHLYMYVYIM
jgi:hypothetical protein